MDRSALAPPRSPVFFTLCKTKDWAVATFDNSDTHLEVYQGLDLLSFSGEVFVLEA
jgi:hypothetical protein